MKIIFKNMQKLPEAKNTLGYDKSWTKQIPDP